jgi:hypothetical protein
LLNCDGLGNQKKVWIDNNLIKIDSKLRESTKEVSAYNIASAFCLNCVKYTRDKFNIDGVDRYGCICESYMKDYDLKAVTIYAILNFYNINIPMNMSAYDYFCITVEAISKYTNISIQNVRDYLMYLLVFDFIIANDDRHLTNIELIQSYNNSFRFTPIYDCGQSFFGKDSELTYNQLEIESRKFKSKPFSTNQYKNLINLDIAKNIASVYKQNAINKYGSIMNIPNALQAHKKIARYRLDLLLNK